MGAARSRQSRRHPLCRPGHYRGETSPGARSTTHSPPAARSAYWATACLISVAVTPKRTGHRAARTGVTRAATPSPTCSSINVTATTATACTYDYNNSGGPRKWYNTTENPAATSPDSYRYTFFAYYPKDGFTVESPASATTRGVPKLTFTMPFGETGDVATTTLNDMQTPDAMVSVVYNHLRTTGNVASISATS